ncbi:MAG: MFS transporter [Bacillota bacterium]
MMEKTIIAQKSRLWTADFCLICLTNTFMFLGFQMFIPTFPLYVEKLGGGEMAVGLTVGIFSISAILSRPISGKLLDQGSRRKIFLIGLVISLVAISGYPLSVNLFLLLLFRLLHGAGFGMATTSAGTIVADLIPPRRLGEGIGYYGLTNTLSMAFAPAVGLFIIYKYNFTALFIISAVLAAVALLVSYFIHCPEIIKKADTSEKYNYIEPAAIIPSLVMLFACMPFGAITTFISLYSIERGIENIGFFFTFYAVILFVSRPLSGILADKHGPSKVVFPGMLLMGIAMAVISMADSYWWFAVAALIFGMGIGLVMPSLQSLTVKKALPSRRGTAMSTFFLSFDVGIGMGSLIWGVVSHMVGFSTMYALTIIPLAAAFLLYIKYNKTEQVQQQN